MELIFAAKGAAALVIIVTLLAWERWRPFAAAPKGTSRVFKNFALAAMNAGLSRILIVPLTAAAALAAPAWRPGFADGGWFILVDLILLDLWIYWWHRGNHELPFLWRFHEVHHLDRFLDVSSAVRFHFGEVILSALVRAVLIMVMDVPLVSVLIFDSIVLAAAGFHHANIRLPEKVERRLRYVIVTPSHHWVHHHRVREDTDSNYGTVLSLWDRLFGSLSPTPRTPSMDIGTEGREEKPLFGLIVRPAKSP